MSEFISALQSQIAANSREITEIEYQTSIAITSRGLLKGLVNSLSYKDQYCKQRIDIIVKYDDVLDVIYENKQELKRLAARQKVLKKMLKALYQDAYYKRNCYVTGLGE